MFVVVFDAGWNTPAVIYNRYRVVRLNNNRDFWAITRQSLINRVVKNLKNQVMKAGSIGGIPDVHAGTFTNRL